MKQPTRFIVQLILREMPAKGRCFRERQEVDFIVTARKFPPPDEKHGVVIVEVRNSVPVVRTAENQIGAEVSGQAEDCFSLRRLLLQIEVYGIFRPKDELRAACGDFLRERKILIKVSHAVLWILSKLPINGCLDDGDFHLGSSSESLRESQLAIKKHAAKESDYP